MTDDRSLERAARSWIEVGPTTAPDRAVEAALLRIQSTPQERDLRIPWRFPKMSMTARFAALVAVGALVVAGAMLLVGGGGRSGPVPTTPPTSAANATTPPTAVPSATVAPAPLALTKTFSSPQYGYTISVASDWTITPATLTWSGPDNNSVDLIEFPDGGGMTLGSIALRQGQTWAEWLNEFQSPNQIGLPCHGGAPNTWPPIAIGGEIGAWQQLCGAGEAIIEHGGRAYVFTFAEGPAAGAIDFEQFHQILASVVFDPAAVPSPPPPPRLDQVFASTRYGYSLRYPAGYVASKATESTNGINIPDPTGPTVDAFVGEAARLVVWSEALPADQTADAWAKAYCVSRRTQWTQPCEGAPENWREIPLKSATARLVVDGEAAGTYLRDESRLFVATAIAGDRAYVISMDGDLNEDLFLAILGSMQLDPGSAAP